MSGEGYVRAPHANQGILLQQSPARPLLAGGMGQAYVPSQPAHANSGLARFGYGYQPMSAPAYTPAIFQPPQLGPRRSFGAPPGAASGPGTTPPADSGGPSGISGAAVGGSSGTAGQAAGIAASGLTGGIPGLVAGLIGAAATGEPVNGLAANAAAQGDQSALDNAISQISADPNIGPPAPTGQDAAAVNDTIGLAIGMDVGTTGQNPDGSPVGSVGNQGESGGVGGDGGGK